MFYRRETHISGQNRHVLWFSASFLKGEPECDILSCQDVQDAAVPGWYSSNLILVFMGLKKIYIKLINYGIASYNWLTTLFCLLRLQIWRKHSYKLLVTCLILDMTPLDFDHSNLGLAWDLKVKTWDLIMICTCDLLPPLPQAPVWRTESAKIWNDYRHK